MTTIWGPGAAEYRFYWYHELASFSSREAAAALVEAHQQDLSFEDAVNGALGPGAAGTDAEQMKERAADSLARGEMLTGSAGASFDPSRRCFGDFRDRSFALGFLARFRSSPIAISRLRSLLNQQTVVGGLPLATAEDVLHGVAILLSSGRVIPGERWYARGGTASDEKLKGTSQPAGPPAAAPGPADDQEDEASTFDNVDAAAQAAGLRAAAAAGVPFCEECAKAALARALQ